MLDRQHAIDMIRTSPLAEFADPLIKQMLPSVRLVVAGDQTATTSERTSHFGGLPWLPRACDWPHWDRDTLLRADISRWEERFKKNPRATGLRDIVAKMRQDLSQGPRPLAFLCQLFLRDLHAATPLDLWPSDGSLAFFYDPLQNWGFDPEARGHCRVFFVPENEELAPVSAPVGLRDESQFPNRPLRFTPDLVRTSETAAENATRPTCHLWLSVTSILDDLIFCSIVEAPHALQLKKEISFVVASESIEDWLIYHGGTAFGGFSLRIIRSRLRNEEQIKFDVQIGVREFKTLTL